MDDSKWNQGKLKCFNQDNCKLWKKQKKELGTYNWKKYFISKVHEGTSFPLFVTRGKYSLKLNIMNNIYKQLLKIS